MALCRLLAQVHDKNGRIAIPGFYDDVAPLSKFEREQFSKLPYNAEQFRKLLGVPAIFGEKGFSHHEQRSARPTFEINGLTSGYQGEGSKTIVPSWASAKITMRLVPNQKPGENSETCAGASAQALSAHGEDGTKGGHGGDAVSRLADESAGAGVVARVETRLRRGADCRCAKAARFRS